MAREKIAITVDENTVVRLDRLVRQGAYPNRSRRSKTQSRRNWSAWTVVAWLVSARSWM